MSDFNPSEKKFEEYIEDHFTSNGYKSVHHSVYNPSQCLISEEVITFIQKSQPEKWNKLCDFHGSDVENKVSAISPVPGGVGPMTIACLLRNTTIAFKNSNLT